VSPCPHNPEVAGSNPAPATRKCRSGTRSPERRSGLDLCGSAKAAGSGRTGRAGTQGTGRERQRRRAGRHCSLGMATWHAHQAVTVRSAVFGIRELRRLSRSGGGGDRVHECPLRRVSSSVAHRALVGAHIADSVRLSVPEREVTTEHISAGSGWPSRREMIVWPRRMLSLLLPLLAVASASVAGPAAASSLEERVLPPV
jgi:hypothetical protein